MSEERAHTLELMAEITGDFSRDPRNSRVVQYNIFFDFYFTARQEQVESILRDTQLKFEAAIVTCSYFDAPRISLRTLVIDEL